MNLALLALCLLLSAVVGVQARRLAQRRRKLALQLRRLALLHSEAARYAAGRARLADVQQLAESAVEGTTATVRMIHREIANIPFDILESIPVTRDTTRLVRDIHDVTADGVYSTISTVNRLLGRGLRNGLQPRPRDDKNDDDPSAPSSRRKPGSSE